MAGLFLHLRLQMEAGEGRIEGEGGRRGGRGGGGGGGFLSGSFFNGALPFSS